MSVAVFDVTVPVRTARVAELPDDDIAERVLRRTGSRFGCFPARGPSFAHAIPVGQHEGQVLDFHLIHRGAVARGEGFEPLRVQRLELGARGAVRAVCARGLAIVMPELKLGPTKIEARAYEDQRRKNGQHCEQVHLHVDLAGRILPSIV